MNEIKVGSEWIDRSSGERAKVDYVGAAFVILTVEGGFERSMHLSAFITEYKPAPVRRTVWLNVYEDDVTRHSTKNGADWMATDALLWQQEVELIDPREGDVKP